MLAGGVFSWLVLMPAIYFFGSHLSTPIYPGTTLISNMSPSDLWSTYVRPMGAGAVAASEERKREDAGGFEIEAEEDERRQSKDDAGGDGLPGISGGLDDVVFEDAGPSEGTQNADGEHRDGDGGRDCKPGAQADVDGDGSEENAEEAAENERAGSELAARFAGRDEGLIGRLDGGAGGHLLVSPRR
jgi:hypothetical protein